MKRVLRWIGLGLAGAIVIAVVTGAVFHQKGTRRLQARFDVQPLTIPIPTDSSAVERGRHLAGSLVLCNACHGDSLSGQVLQNEPGMMTLAEARGHSHVVAEPGQREHDGGSTHVCPR